MIVESCKEIKHITNVLCEMVNAYLNVIEGNSNYYIFAHKHRCQTFNEHNNLTRKRSFITASDNEIIRQYALKWVK